MERLAVGIHADGEALLKAFPGAVALCDLEGDTLIVNNALIVLTGAHPGGMVAKHVTELFAREFRPAIDEALAKVAMGHRVKDIRAGCLTSHGTTIPVSLALSLLEPAEGGTQLAVVSIRDSTREEQLAGELNRTQSESESLLAELDEAYQQLRRAQDEQVRKERLSVSGELAASVAHEIRNPLAVIGMSIQYLHSKLSPGHAFRQCTSAIVKKVKQLDEITTQLIDYGRPRKLELEARDLHRNLNQVLCLAKSKCLAQQVKIIKRFDRGPSKVICDHHLMNQVFTNLVMNALQAMSKRGVLTVETQFDLQKNQAVIHIGDTGCGIPPSVQAQLCKPFFTTKHNGTGLGLAISHRIIDHHHGSLTYTSKTRGRQRGTTFTIKIPITPPEEKSPTG
ncbi:MAG: PAS domain S-box protein [Acidobacteria bacterium]|nr:PAS domain S-box protein [Acidobacteriota bacterium]